MLGDGFHDVPQGKLAMVVTHLEMRARVDTRPVPAPEGVSLHPMHNVNLEEYRDLFRRVGEEWLWFSRAGMSDADVSAILNDPDVSLFTLEVNGQSEALLELDFRIKDACELGFFGLTRALIGRGAGRYLMNFAIDTAWAQPINRFHLHTCTIDSPMALNFYLRSGFKAVKRQVEIADDPRNTTAWDNAIAPQIPLITP